MKKGLVLGLGAMVLFTGCCKKLELRDCCDNGCQQPKKVKPVKAKPTVVKKKPVIKKIRLGNQECIIQNGVKTDCVFILEAKGVGVVPNGACSTAQAKAMARRAAVLDAYKALAEKMYGIQINGRDTVKNMILQDSNLKAYVSGLIRGAKIEDETFKDGMYQVSMSVTLDINKWNEYLRNYTVNNYR